MYVADPPSPTGWPWPLDAVQGWFEDLWDSITAIPEAAANWVWDLVPSWLKDPIRALKDWFDGLWISIRNIVGWWDPIQGRFVGGFLGWLWDTLNLIGSMISQAAGWTWEQIQPVVSGIATGFGDLMNWIWTKLTDIAEWITGKIWAWVEGSLRWLTDTFQWLRDEISDTGGWIVDSVVTAFNGAFAGITEVFSGWPELLTSAVFNIFKPLFVALGARVRESSPFDLLYEEIPPGWPKTDMGWLEGAIGKGLESGIRWVIESITWFMTSAAGWLQETILTPLWEGLTWLWNLISWKATEALESVSSLFEGFSSITPEQAFALAPKVLIAAAGLGLAATGITSVAGLKIIGSGIEVGEIGSYIKDLLSPGMFVGATVGTLIGVGLTTPLRYYYQKAFTPLIPPSGDLINMVVREAFDPKMVIKAPDIFAESMTYHGYKREWSDRYWTAHFIPIALRQAYENLWRGLWTKEQFMYALHIADIHPMWREDIYNVAFTAPSTRELGYGYDTGLYSVEDIIKYRRWGGLSPEDAEKAGRAMVAYRTEAEREALRREAMADFEAGLDDEAQFRANLEALGGRPEIIDYWVARATFRKDRDVTLDLMKTSVDQYVKGWIDEGELEQDLIALGFVAERRAVIMRDAGTRRLKYKRQEETERKKLMTLAKIEKARELGLISDPEYVRRIVDAGYSEDDAKLMLQIELTPRPVTPEEVERRRRTVLSRRRRTERRYERLLARIEDQIKVTAGMLDDVAITRDESLDIIDTQITIIDEELPVATPERAATLTARRLVLVQRRELQVARFESRIRILTEQQTNLIELRDLYTKQRDEELAEYDEELKLLEVAG